MQFSESARTQRRASTTATYWGPFSFALRPSPTVSTFLALIGLARGWRECWRYIPKSHGVTPHRPSAQAYKSFPCPFPTPVGQGDRRPGRGLCGLSFRSSSWLPLYMADERLKRSSIAHRRTPPATNATARSVFAGFCTIFFSSSQRSRPTPFAAPMPRADIRRPAGHRQHLRQQRAVDRQCGVNRCLVAGEFREIRREDRLLDEGQVRARGILLPLRNNGCRVVHLLDDCPHLRPARAAFSRRRPNTTM